MKAENKNKLYEFIKEADRRLQGNPRLLDVISSLWNVYQRPSTGDDYRYKKLGDEIEKHHILNDDWPQDKLYISILKILDDDEKLLKFVRELLNMEEIRNDDVLVGDLRKTLNNEGLDIHEMNNVLFIGSSNQPLSVKCDNDVPFVVCKSTIERYLEFKEKDIVLPEDDKCYVVTFNNEWNDFDWFTWFRIYYKEGDHLNEIGRIKIMKGNTENVFDVLPMRFFRLSDEFCSLGYDITFYTNVYKKFKQNAISFLSLLQDSATNNNIENRYSGYTAFTQSLIRDNCSERALREGRFYINGIKMDHAYSFTFSYVPPYIKENSDIPKKDPLNIEFDFKYKCPSFKRAIGMIGENGVGKSSLIKDLCEAIANRNKDCFVGDPPLFSKIMILSFSPFDIYQTSLDNSIIEYRYYGLLNSNKDLLSKGEQIANFKDNLNLIKKRTGADKFLEIWKTVIMDVIPFDTIISFFKNGDENGDLENKKIDEFCKNMSSGESIFVYSLTEIIANIRYDTLIMFDEPEQHLHPRAITKLLRAIYRVLDKFESYAIIATHSPLVIREMVSDNVLVFSREDMMLNVTRIGIESFGEDISVLSDIVFHNMNDEKRYENVVDELARKYKNNYEKIVKELQGERNKLGLSAKLMIRTIIENRMQK